MKKDASYLLKGGGEGGGIAERGGLNFYKGAMRVVGGFDQEGGGRAFLSSQQNMKNTKKMNSMASKTGNKVQIQHGKVHQKKKKSGRHRVSGDLLDWIWLHLRL